MKFPPDLTATDVRGVDDDGEAENGSEFWGDICDEHSTDACAWSDGGTRLLRI